MKCQVKVIILYGVCLVGGLVAMDHGFKHGQDPFVTLPGIPNQLPDRLLSTGYCALQNELQRLYGRIRDTPKFLHPLLNKKYTKYLDRLQTKYLDKANDGHSAQYQDWANRLHELTKSSYTTILVKTYPKTSASLMTAVGIVVLAGITGGAYWYFQYYKQQQEEAEKPAIVGVHNVIEEGVLSTTEDAIPHESMADTGG